MKYIKTKIIAGLACLSIIGLLMFGGAGCSTVVTPNPNGGNTTNQVVNAEAIVPVLNAVVPIAVEVAIQKDPKAVAYFDAATVVLDTVIANGTTDPTAINNALNGLNVTNQYAELAVQAGISIYDSFAAQAVSAKLQSSQFILVLQALDTDIKQGVAFSTAGTNVVGATQFTVTVKK